MGHDFPLLGGIATLIRWTEELVSLMAGPLLTVGLGIALTDLLTGGRLLSSLPVLLFVWAVAQAIGIEAQLVAAWDRCRRAIRERRWLAVIGLVLLGSALGYVGFLSAEAFNMQQSFGLTEVEALARLGIDPVSWALQRAGLAVFLVALSGFTRFHPAPKAQTSLEDERAALLREMELEPLRQQVNAAKVRGMRGMVAALTGRETMKDTSLTTTPLSWPSDGDVEAIAEPMNDQQTHRFQTPEEKKNAGKPTQKIVPNRDTNRRNILPAKERVYSVLSRSPMASLDTIARRAHVAPSTAVRHRKAWRETHIQSE